MLDAPRKELARFRDICEAIGEALGHQEFGIVGCPPHAERVLASQCAKAGLVRVNPVVPFSAAGVPDNRLYAEDRIRFVRRASAAVFIGGSDGTLSEYRLCASRGVDPLIPIGGAGGAGAELARRLGASVAGFWSCGVDRSVIAVLSSVDQRPSAYGAAVLAVLAAHPIRPKAPPDDEEPVVGDWRYSDIDDED